MRNFKMTELDSVFVGSVWHCKYCNSLCRNETSRVEVLNGEQIDYVFCQKDDCMRAHLAELYPSKLYLTLNGGFAA